MSSTVVITRRPLSTPSKSLWQDALDRIRRNRAAVVSAYFIALVCLIGVFAEILAPYPFDQQNLEVVLSPPSARHWLGTDSLGRDMLSRLIHGARSSVVTVLP